MVSRQDNSNKLSLIDEDGSEESESSTNDAIEYSGGGGDKLKSSGSGTISFNETSTNDGDRDEIKNRLSNQETRKVAILRLLVIAVLVCSAAAVCTVTYILSRNSEQDAYKTQYDGSSSKIVESFESLHDRLGIINMVGMTATKYGLLYSGSDSDNNTASIKTRWPFITVPHFHQTASTVRSLSGVLYVSVAPVVSDIQREEWEEYVAIPQSKSWIVEGLAYQEQKGENGFEYEPPPFEDVVMSNMTGHPIFYYGNYSSDAIHYEDNEVVDEGPGSYLPTWQANPVLMKQHVNENILRRPSGDSVQACLDQQEVTFGPFHVTPAGFYNDTNEAVALIATLRSVQEKKIYMHSGSPVIEVSIPIFDSLMSENRQMIGVLSVTTSFRRIYFDNVLPDNILGIIAVVSNTCGGQYTYEVDGTHAKGLNLSDMHDSRYDSLKRQSETLGKDTTLVDGSVNGTGFDASCQYYVEVFPSQKFEDEYVTHLPLYVTLAVAGVFMITIMVFFTFNRFVEKRQHMVLEKAAHSTAIVSSLFPKQVRDRLLETDEQRKQIGSGKGLKNVVSGDSHNLNGSQIADLFPDCTVLFADIVGFTAWSSTRAPEHVFILLQTIYQGFDHIARRRKVFKVETIGDCYLAATGLPDPQPAHAVIMARFAMECKRKMTEMTTELEATLGPDCSALKMRLGMHSGAVTAGVLMGDRARFQLFGDTVNTAARMESTGVKDKIHISEATANILIESGKSDWVKPREDMVEAKGKGVLKTFWLNTHGSAKLASESGSSSICESNTDASSNVYDEDAENSLRRERLIDWVVELLADQIKKVIVKNKAMWHQGSTSSVVPYIPKDGEICLDDVREVIYLSKFDESIVKTEINPSDCQMSSEALSQLRHYVQLIAAMYHKNPFHNFEHACHVALSVSKLLNRIVAPDLSAEDTELLKGNSDKELKAHLHASTYGINSDPLAQFAIVFSALIHDVDHRGCSNAQLIKEEVGMGIKYKNKSVAEQNSLDLSWNLLMSDEFDTLRKIIFSSQEEMLRFRQIIVNSVLATDIFDKELNDLRKLRWTNAFSGTHKDDEHDLDRKATVVIEHIIQASDVSHTMQHWHVYQRWNSMLFKEMYQAYTAGRMAVDPSTFWYQGEMNFYDNYVIPLAKKLKECNVFGVSSDEYLNYAVGNRQEWEHKGEALVADIVREVVEEANLHN